MMKHTRRSAVTALLGAILLLTSAGASGATRDVTVTLTSGLGEFRLRVID